MFASEIAKLGEVAANNLPAKAGTDSWVENPDYGYGKFSRRLVTHTIFDVEKQTWQPSYAIDIIDIIMLSSPVLVSFVKRCRRMWAMTSPPRHWQLAPVEVKSPFLHDHVVEPSKFGNGMILAADRSCPIHEAHFWRNSLSARLFRPEALHALVACWSC